eukprot:TRINITY_DN20354_c0_g1_i1.p1 TRINITY_DN20354_c0_g1~~TRINITY_DN20354_c0_g1_i1.p1  ORF type:complete len:404 (+),score=36.98 TRINITY_DN20354_c0_g1_i1:285-1496(+)
MDSRMDKYIALVIHMNLWGATACSVIFASAAACLQWYDHLPRHGPWCLATGYLSFLVGLATWHRLPAVSRLQGSFFLDKLCIHQTNQAMKKKGTESFASFLKRSEKMLMLWSPNYFKRLWCTLEIAALVQAHRQQRFGYGPVVVPLEFVPLTLAKTALVSWSIMFAVTCLHDVSVALSEPGIAKETNAFIVIAAVLIVSISPAAGALRRFCRERKNLSAQLENFRVEDADCTEEADRAIIMATVSNWYQNADDFNQCVRTVVRESIAQSIGEGNKYPWKLLVGIVLVRGFNELDNASRGLWADYEVPNALAALAFFPFSCSIMLLFVRLSWLFSKERKSRIADMLVSSFIGLSSLTYTAAVYWFIVAGLPRIPIGPALLLVALLFVLCLLLQCGMRRAGAACC